MEKPRFEDLTLTPVNSCNLKCKMCSLWKKKKLPPVALSHYKDFITELLPYKSPDFQVGIVGAGETLLYKDLYRLLSFVNSKGIANHIVTNGTLLTKENVKRLVDSGLSSINLSLDSHKPEIHDFIRGKKGVYEKCLRGIEFLKAQRRKIFISITSVLMSYNLKDSAELVSWALNNAGADVIQLNIVSQPLSLPFDHNWHLGEYSHLWPRDLKLINEAFQKLYVQKKIFGARFKNSEKQLQAFYNYLINPLLSVKKGRCNLHRKICVQNDGLISFCKSLPETSCQGNINDRTALSRIVEQENYIKIVSRIESCDFNCHQMINCWFDD